METTARKFIVIVLVSLAALPVKAAEAPTAADLLDKYTKALDSLRSTIVKAEITTTHAGAFSRDFRDPGVRGRADRGTSYRRTELRTDGKRVHSRGYSWGHVSSAFPSIPKEQAQYSCINWDGEQLYSYGIRVNHPKSQGTAHFYKPPKNEDKGELGRKFPASYLMGYNLESDERMDSILRRARSISVRQKTERIGGSDCYVIDAKTDSGRIFLWIDPAHGYHLAKAEARLAPGDLVFGRNRLPKGDRRTTRLDNVRFRKVDDIWVPTEADAYMDRHFGGRNHTTQTWHYKRTEVVVNPDHEALGSFDNPIENPENDPELKNGADVHIHHIPGDQPQYIWQDGRVIDKTGKVIMDSQPKQKSDSKESQSDVLGKKPPTVWDLLQKERQKQVQAAEDKQRTPYQAKLGPAAALELLDKYTEALDSLRSTVVKAEITSTHAGAFGRDFRLPEARGLADRGTSYRRTELRTDGKRVHWREYSWGHISSTFPSIPEAQAHYKCHNWDGEQLYSYGIAVNNPKSHGIAYFYKPPKNEDKGELSRKFPASYLMGYNLEGDERMDSILRRSRNVSVRQKTERIGGSDCYVIDAKTDRGRIFLWIDPAHGYHLAKAEARLAPGDLVFGRNRLPKGDRRTTRLDNVRFKKVGDIWVPTEADAYMDRHFGGRNHTTQKWHYKRTEVVVNPDHEALGSFDNPLENPKNDPELKNGADVYIQHISGDQPQYIWQDGRVVDESGRVIMDGRPKKKSDSKESQGDRSGKKPPSAWDLLRKQRQKKLQAARGGDKQHVPNQVKPEPPMVGDLLDKLSEALDSAGSTSFIAKGESTQEHEYRFSKNYREPGWRGIRDKGTCYRREEFRTDGERYHLRQYSWGHISSQDSSVPEDRPIFYCLNYAAENELYRHSVRINPGQPGGIVMISKLDSSKISHMDYRLQGYVLPSHERADLILRRAESVSVRPKTEQIGGSECYVIDAKTDSGRISLWIDPGHGYHLVRAEVRATQRDTIRLENFHFKEVDGVWVPMELDMSSDLDYGGGSFTRSKIHYKRTEIVLNPDHDALGSFENPLENPKNDPELKNGTFVRKDGSRYVWQDGRVVDESGRVIMDGRPKKKSDSKESQGDSSGKKPPSAWDLLRKQRQKKLQAARGGDKQRPPDQAKSEPPTAADLLDKYTEALDSLRSTIVKAEITSTHAGRFARDFRDPAVRGLADRGTSYRRTELRTDGKRSHWREYSWGHISSTFPSLPEEQAHYCCHNWDGEQLYSYGIAVNNPKSHGIAHLYKHPKNNEEKGELSRKFPASYLMGYDLEGDERMDSILRRAKSISVRQKTERISGSDCYVIDAKTDSGRIFLWIDPAHGYHLARAEARLAPGDLGPGRHPLPKGDRRTTRLQNVRFKKVDDIWVPTEADAYMDRHFGGRNHTTQTWHYKRTEVVVNPDHEALGSFDNPIENPENDPELKNGADVYIHGDQTRYIWQDGKLIPDER